MFHIALVSFAERRVIMMNRVEVFEEITKQINGGSKVFERDSRRSTVCMPVENNSNDATEVYIEDGVKKITLKNGRTGYVLEDPDTLYKW